ncbi:dTDP-4-dehydrorhamnose reductase [Ensifer sp. ENS02]|uniref:dTDP-4-dehydrorhamnose reductase n=1 Tax=Ensifer sp. ENS02 TaxID=2769290 RepID=UPI000DD70E09|nr:dTDP-4-dehydrorhamnose reductase [Ensifer sp. ENS02]MBD9520723.1 dTDP-4-dehydrorhamnose reductase [Ensifer sp. ENS02]
MIKRRILITGGTGQVGGELLRYSWPKDVELVAPTRNEVDLANCDRLEQYVSTGSFSAVVNSGAYTAVDRAESDILSAWKVNALAPAALASATRVLNIPLLQLSTDYVFDGVKDGLYLEDDPIAPVGVYGASKEAGEQAVRSGNPRHIILRTAWVISAHGNNFVKTMLRLGREKPVVRVVNDQRGCPTSASDIAATLAAITLRSLNDSDGFPTGTYHFVNGGHATWYDLAREVFKECKNAGYPVPTLEPIATNEYPTPARRPLNSRLSTEKLKRDFGIEPREWASALRPVLTDLLGAK